MTIKESVLKSLNLLSQLKSKEPNEEYVNTVDKAINILTKDLIRSVKIKPFNIYDFVGKDDKRLTLTGVFNDVEHNCQIATDSYVAIINKGYDAFNPNKIIDKNGKELTDVKYPNIFRLMPTDGTIIKLKSIEEIKKEYILTQILDYNIDDSNISAMQVSEGVWIPCIYISRLLTLIKHYGSDSITWTFNFDSLMRPLVGHVKQDIILVMPCLIND